MGKSLTRWGAARAWMDQWTCQRGLGRAKTVSVARAKAAKEMAEMEALRREWEDGGPEEFPGLRVDPWAWGASCDGLAAFFEAGSRAKGPAALPSAAADAVWHAWLRIDPKGLDEFCKRHFGRAVVHESKEQMAGPMGPALARCWAACCAGEGVDPLSGKLPSLFELDSKLSMPGGWRYSRESGGKIGCVQLGRGGRALGAAVAVGALTAAGLAEAGAIDQASYQAWLAQNKARQAQSTDGSSGGSSCSLGSCGSSCGGGCGGD